MTRPLPSVRDKDAWLRWFVEANKLRSPHAEEVATVRRDDQLVADGLLKKVGDTHEITEAGHEWTRALIARARAHNDDNSYLKG